MNVSMQWQLKDSTFVRVGKNPWRHVAQFQPGLWRVGNGTLDLSFLTPDSYEFVIADSRYDTALIKKALAEIVLYLNESGIKTEDLALRVDSDREILADECRQLLGSWVYGSLTVVKQPTGNKRLLVTQVGANPAIDHDEVIYIVPAGDGTISTLTDDRNKAWQEYDMQCGSDIPLSDLVIAYDSAMKDASPFGSEERTNRQVKKLKQLLKPDGQAILIADGAHFGSFGNVVVVEKDKYVEALALLEENRDCEWQQVVLLFDLAYTKVRNVIF